MDTNQNTNPETESTIRRHLLTAAGGGALAITMPTVSAYSGDESVTERDGEKFCPLENEVKVTSEPNTPSDKDEVWYDIDVTGVLELKSGRRVGRVKGSIAADTRRGVTFSYSGEIKYFAIRGPGGIQLEQNRPCDPNKNESSTDETAVVTTQIDC